MKIQAECVGERFRQWAAALECALGLWLGALLEEADLEIDEAGRAPFDLEPAATP